MAAVIPTTTRLPTARLYLCILHTLEEETVFVPMESGIIVVLVDLVVAEHKSVDRLCIQDGLVEHLKDIILDNNAAVEIKTLPFQIGNFRINGDDGVRELELIGECIYKTVFANQHVVARARLKPTVAIAAQQDGRPRRVVEKVPFNHRATRRTEQRAACPIVANHVVGKIDFRRPRQVLDAECAGFANGSVDRLLEGDAELFGAVFVGLICRLDGGNPVGCAQHFHCPGVDELHRVARPSPLEAVGLRMHIFPQQCTVVNAFLYL